MSEWKKIERYFNRRPLRERVLWFATLLAIVFFVWDGLFLTRISLNKQSANKEQVAINNSITNLNNKLLNLKTVLKSQPDKPYRDKIKQLSQVNKGLEAQISNLTAQLIAPKTMAKVLSDIVSQDEGLVLTKINNLPGLPLFDETHMQNNDNNKKVFQVYKHGLMLEFEADYFATKQFLQRLEASEWNFLWDNLIYDVMSHPSAKVSLTLYTLSLDNQWIGI